MTDRRQVYKCEICGNIVGILHEGVGELVCCKQPMKLMEENTVDAAIEKHVPVVTKTETGFKVTVGDVPHPMEDEHYIEWIQVLSGSDSCRKFLEPGSTPEAEFPGKSDKITARAYCNLHGLWQSQ